MLRAVTLDFWNTLFVDDHGAERERRRAAYLRSELAGLGFNPPGGAIEEALLSAHGYFDRQWHQEQRTPSCPELVDVILSTLQVRIPNDVAARIVASFERLMLDIVPETVAGAPQVVRDLAERYRLAVICDTGYSPGSVLRQLLERHDMLAPFDYLYFSNEGGRSKPHASVFRRVLAELGVRATEAAHVGDIQRTDIAGAQQVGMWAIHFVGVSNRDLAVSTADAVIRRLDELPVAAGNLQCPGC